MPTYKQLYFCTIATLLFLATALPAAALDFSKAVTVGSGPKTVVEFTDPDCPFCRQASLYFDKRPDVTRQVFFYPLPRHPKAKEKVQFILSQKDKASAYHQVMSGSMDGVQKFDASPDGIKLQGAQMEIAKKAGVRSTPTFMISGRIIEGLDLKKIEEALGK
ncbi:thioredoxin fold domain-containing protein [Pelotalea chapellei]|uniref:Thioredoxin fold domain-containing protein n=1 Tax=Pelotalea chapellei TaxID=44671 RepID=A0ABS5U6P4_9BACT|nr:thioredoxin domain-containing protein [Pelotalea chapellei]MBT1071318.1 thioredoxin fold domain-containing protein [Pelotalea chapellei]